MLGFHLREPRIQPNRNKASSLTQRQNAAKTQLTAAFGALRGFPVRTPSGAWGWVAVDRDGAPPVVAATLPSEAVLREAAKAASALPKAFPRVWKDIVGDPDAWEARATATIAALRAARSSNAPLPALPPLAASPCATPLSNSSSTPPSPFACALAWTYCFTPLATRDIAKLAPFMDQVLALATPVITAPPGLRPPEMLGRAIQWLELLSEHSPASIAAWRTLWLDPSTWTPPDKQAWLGRALFSLYPQLAAIAPSHRTVVMRVVAANPSRELGDTEVREIVDMLARATPAQTADIERIAERLNATDPALRLGTRLLRRWSEFHLPADEWLRALARHLSKRTLTLADIMPWNEKDDPLHSAWEHDHGRTFKPEFLLSAVDALAAIDAKALERRPSAAARTLGEVCTFAPDASTAARAAQALLAADPSHKVRLQQLRCLWRIAGADPARFGSLAAPLAKAREDPRSSPLFAPDGLPSDRAIPLGWLGDLILAGHATDVVRFLETSTEAAWVGIDLSDVVAQAESELVLTAPSLPQGCPPSMRLAIEELLHREPAALEAAADELASALPSRAKLAEELSSVEALLAAGNSPASAQLARRRDSLRARLASPQPLSHARQATLLTRIEKRAKRLRLDAWRKGLDDVLVARIHRALDLQVPREWLAEPLKARCLHAIGDLEEEFQRLAGRVLAARADGTWSGHLDDPANARWIARARAAGIDADRWLRGIPPSEFEHAAHGRLVIDLERDPLEILKIGAWFKTCLAPHGGNFFSTIVVAADANKRVIVVRNGAGEPVARTIIALDGNMRFWAFRVYSHDTDTTITAAVEAHAERIAAACGAAKSGLGEVEPLTASRWYDDDDQRAFRTFRRVCEQQADPDAALKALRRECGDDMLRANAIAWIGRQATGRGETAAPLTADQRRAQLRLFELMLGLADLSTLNDDTVADLLAAFDRPESKDLTARILDACRGLELTSPKLALAFVRAGDPREAMRVLRRESRCYQWPWDRAASFEALAEVQLALGRPRKAVETLDQAIEFLWSSGVADGERLKRRKREIEARIDDRRAAQASARRGASAG